MQSSVLARYFSSLKAGMMIENDISITDTFREPTQPIAGDRHINSSIQRSRPEMSVIIETSVGRAPHWVIGVLIVTLHGFCPLKNFGILFASVLYLLH